MLTNTHSYVRRNSGKKIIAGFLFNKQYPTTSTQDIEEGYEDYTRAECNICPISMKTHKSTKFTQMPHLVSKNKFKVVIRQLRGH